MGCLNPLPRIWTLAFGANTKLDFSSVYNPQTNGQTKVVNRSLGNLLRSLVEDHVKRWDHKLSQAEFTFNHLVNRSMGLCPFPIVYGIPWAPIDLAPVPDLKRVHGKAEDFIEQLQQIYKSTQQKLINITAKYKAKADQKRRFVEFNVGDFIYAVLKGSVFY